MYMDFTSFVLFCRMGLEFLSPKKKVKKEKEESYRKDSCFELLFLTKKERDERLILR
jgi:hypothetical protein